MLRITVYDSFTGLEMTDEWNSEQECREFYALELGTEPEHVQIIMIEQELKGASRK